MRELCALLACSRSEHSKPVANASRPLTPLSMNLCDSFGVEELVTAPVSNAPLDHSHFHPTCKLRYIFRISAPPHFRLFEFFPQRFLRPFSFTILIIIIISFWKRTKELYICIGNSIVIVWNFIKVTVDNTRSRVTRRFATMGIVLRNSAWQA